MSSIVDYGYLFRFTVFEEWQAVDQNNPLWLRGDFPIEFCLYSLTQFIGHQPSITEESSVALSTGTSSRLQIVVVLAHLTALLLDTTDSDSDTIMTDAFENSIIRESMEAFEAKSIPTTRFAIEALEKFRFQQKSDSISVGECIICLEEFETGSELIRMPCSHVYHGHCILKWL
ncbi:NEP1-interacting protein-like 1 [Fagus crenata]